MIRLTAQPIFIIGARIRTIGDIVANEPRPIDLDKITKTICDKNPSDPICTQTPLIGATVKDGNLVSTGKPVKVTGTMDIRDEKVVFYSWVPSQTMAEMLSAAANMISKLRSNRGLVDRFGSLFSDPLDAAERQWQSSVKLPDNPTNRLQVASLLTSLGLYWPNWPEHRKPDHGDLWNNIPSLQKEIKDAANNALGSLGDIGKFALYTALGLAGAYAGYKVFIE